MGIASPDRSANFGAIRWRLSPSSDICLLASLSLQSGALARFLYHSFAQKLSTFKMQKRARPLTTEMFLSSTLSQCTGRLLFKAFSKTLKYGIWTIPAYFTNLMIPVLCSCSTRSSITLFPINETCNIRFFSRISRISSSSCSLSVFSIFLNYRATILRLSSLVEINAPILLAKIFTVSFSSESSSVRILGCLATSRYDALHCGRRAILRSCCSFPVSASAFFRWV